MQNTMSKTRITILANDVADEPALRAEHGLAFWIEREGRFVLFDTGQGSALVPNAEALGIRLERTSAVLLSHGHYDHTGGLHQILARAPSATVHAHASALEARYVGDDRGERRSIGMPEVDRSALRRAGALVATGGPTEIVPGLFLTGPIPRETSYEDSGGPFSSDPEGRGADAFEDDQAVYFETGSGVGVILGCAHAGVVNTLRHIRRLTGDRPLELVLGGMHLLAASEERLERTIRDLARLEPRRLVPIHCTGARATTRLLEAFPERCARARAGDRFEID